MSKKHPIDSRIQLAPYTLAQELWNSISHGVGAIFGIVVLVLMILKSMNSSDNDSTLHILKMISGIYYSVSIIICMSISCIYHSLKKNRGKRVLRVIDHAMVYLLIAGSYAPFCLVALYKQPLWGINGTENWANYFILALCYTFIIIGVVFSSINLHKYNTLALIMYILGGITILINPVQIYRVIGLGGSLFFFSSGVIYLIGSVLFAIGQKKSLWWHTIFHFFVLAGIVLMFISIYCYVY